VGQYSFFDIQDNANNFKSSIFVEIPNIPEWPENQLLAYEKEMLGFYITKHPLINYEGLLRRLSSCSTKRLAQKRDGDEVVTGGILNKVKFTMTKRTGEKMAIGILEDLEGTVDVLFFPSCYQKSAPNIKKDKFVYIKGRINLREEEPKIIADEVLDLEEAQYKISKTMLVSINNLPPERELFESLKNILRKYQGSIPVYIAFSTKTNGRVEMLVSKELNIKPSSELVKEIEELVGEGSVALKC
jgi:DNA polymerase-3 subunit alpha